MRPKFEWLLNIIAIVCFLIVGGLLVFLARFPVGMMVEGLVFYGGIAYLLLSVWRDHRAKKPRR